MATTSWSPWLSSREVWLVTARGVGADVGMRDQEIPLINIEMPICYSSLQ